MTDNTSYGVMGLLVLLILAVVAIGLIGFAKFDRYTEMVGRSDCAKDYRLEYTNTAESTKIIHPIADEYEQCLREKGLVSIKGN